MRDSNKKAPRKRGLLLSYHFSVNLPLVELWARGNQCFTFGVICVLVEVVDEARCQVFGFAFPLQWVNISITWSRIIGSTPGSAVALAD